MIKVIKCSCIVLYVLSHFVVEILFWVMHL